MSRTLLLEQLPELADLLELVDPGTRVQEFLRLQVKLQDLRQPPEEYERTFAQRDELFLRLTHEDLIEIENISRKTR